MTFENESVTPCAPDSPSWFAQGTWPVCKCGYAPRDNYRLTQHWAAAGFSVHDRGGQLIVTRLGAE